jgi:flagellar motor switch protein FliN/FliY
VINRTAEVNLDLSVELGRVRVPLEVILNWTEGSLIELNRIAGEPADVRVSGQPFARGEVVVIAEHFGVRLTEMGPHPPTLP